MAHHHIGPSREGDLVADANHERFGIAALDVGQRNPHRQVNDASRARHVAPMHGLDAHPTGNGLADDGLGCPGVHKGLEGRVALRAGGAIGPHPYQPHRHEHVTHDPAVAPENGRGQRGAQSCSPDGLGVSSKNRWTQGIWAG